MSTLSPSGAQNGAHPTGGTSDPGTSSTPIWARPSSDGPADQGQGMPWTPAPMPDQAWAVTTGPSGMPSSQPMQMSAAAPIQMVAPTSMGVPGAAPGSTDVAVPGYMPAPAYLRMPSPSPVPPPTAPTPMPAPTASAPVRRRTATARVVDGLLVLSLVVAAGGIGYAVGRQTAPSTQGSGNGRTFAGRFGNGTTGNGTTGNGTTGNGTTQGAGTGTTQGAGTGQLAAPPSGAPALPAGTTAPAASSAPAPSTAPGGTVTGQGGPGRGAFGRGGLSGTVSAVDPTTITVTTAGGQELQVTTTDATTYHQQVAATADEVTVGSAVRITLSGGFGGPGGGFGGPAASAAPGTQQTMATEIELLGALPQATGTGGRGGFRGNVTGTVSAVDAGTITVTTAAGQQDTIATDPSTVWAQQTTITRDGIATGAEVRFTAEGGFGGFGGNQGSGGQGTTGQGVQNGPPAITASDVEVLLPTAQ